MKSDSVPAFALEKEALKTEIEAGIQTGVEQMASGQKDKKPVEKYHNIADFYDTDSFELFEIVDGATYTIRDYGVTITKGTTDKALEVCVQGKAEGLVFVD